MLAKIAGKVELLKVPTVRRVTLAGLEVLDPQSEISESVTRLLADYAVRSGEVFLVCPISAVVQTDGTVIPEIGIGYPELVNFQVVFLPVGGWISVEINNKKIRFENRPGAGLRELQEGSVAQVKSVADRYKAFVDSRTRAA